MATDPTLQIPPRHRHLPCGPNDVAPRSTSSGETPTARVRSAVESRAHRTDVQLNAWATAVAELTQRIESAAALGLEARRHVLTLRGALMLLRREVRPQLDRFQETRAQHLGPDVRRQRNEQLVIASIVGLKQKTLAGVADALKALHQQATAASEGKLAVSLASDQEAFAQLAEIARGAQV